MCAHVRAGRVEVYTCMALAPALALALALAVAAAATPATPPTLPQVNQGRRTPEPDVTPLHDACIRVYIPELG